MRPTTQFTMPRYEPLSPGSSVLLGEARLKVRLACLWMEAQEKPESRQAQLKLEIRKLEIEADKAVRLLENYQKELPALCPSAQAGMTPPSTASTCDTFDICKNINVPPFRDTEVDFAAFERVASALRLPFDVWPLLLQCKIHGKAQEAVAALLFEDSLNYDLVKMAHMRSYELVPEAYRQKFRHHKRAPVQTHVEFAREKGTLFDKWCSACKANDFNSLCEFVILEEFKKCLPECIVVYLKEQKVSSLSEAAVLADEYVLTHQTMFLSVSERPPVPSPQQ